MKVDKRVTSRSRCPSAFDSRYSAGRKFFLHALSRGNLASSTSHVSPLRQPRLAHDTTRRYFGGCTSIVAASLPGDSLFSASRSHPSSAPRRFRFYRWKLTVIAGRSIFLARKTVLREIFCNIGEVDNYSRNCTKIQKKRSVLLFCVFCNASRGGEIFPKIRKKFTLQNFARIASSNRQSSSHWKLSTFETSCGILLVSLEFFLTLFMVSFNFSFFFKFSSCLLLTRSLSQKIGNQNDNKGNRNENIHRPG